MSRIGKKPVRIPAGVKASMNDRELVIEKGSDKLTQWIDPRIDVSIDDSTINFAKSGDEKRDRELHGLYRALAANMVEGLTKGYAKTLKITGVGFTARLEGKFVVLSVGFANDHRVEVLPGVKVEVPDPATVVVKGIDKHAVGQVAANIRRVRPPEPYKGKGIRYEDEIVRRKAGKTVGAGG